MKNRRKWKVINGDNTVHYTTEERGTSIGIVENLCSCCGKIDDIFYEIIADELSLTGYAESVAQAKRASIRNAKKLGLFR